MKRALKRWLAAAVVSLVSTTAAWAQADWDAVVEKAKGEGKVVVYGSTFGNALYKAVVANFEKKYGIKVETLDIRASEIYERVRVEQSAGRYIADIIMSPVSVVTVIERADLLQKRGHVPNMENLRPALVESLGGNEYRVPLYTGYYGILVNARVKPEDEPKKWTDLLDPKWKGKIILDDPRAIGNGFALFNATYKGIGPEFQQRLAQQQPVISRQVRNDERRVAHGEFPLYAPHVFPFFLELKGLPLRFIFPEEGVPNADTQAVVPKNAPHPNAAHVFINYILDPESQLMYGNAGYMPVVSGIDDRLNEEVKPMLGVKRFPQVDLDDMRQLMEQAKEWYR